MTSDAVYVSLLLLELDFRKRQRETKLVTVYVQNWIVSKSRLIDIIASAKTFITFLNGMFDGLSEQITSMLLIFLSLIQVQMRASLKYT